MSCNLVDSLISCIDEARSIPTQLGVQTDKFYVVSEVMNEVTKDWTETNRLEILPCPNVVGESSIPWKAMPAGRMLNGRCTAYGISLKYTREQLAPRSDEKAFRLHYELVATDGHKISFAASCEPYEDRESIQWTIELQTTSPSSRR